ncbi:VOC family protein [Microtetraspora sp. AC03309]|uniref:VOC family protein n=1 Tax=Microtetraspora sp. AC03309 TaxID=2779376 RepID=UPI001E58FC9E|nr:VOC family protein [Microtetraspora sp. AC03309]MCC5580334.1 VOC family protein [Microtetraspora sp. AC03309]
MSKIESLGYVVLRGPLQQWKEFGTEVLGAQLVAGPDDSTALLRTDERAFRIVVQDGPAGHDALLAIGFEVATPQALDDLVADLTDEGIEVTEDAELARARRVQRLVTFKDGDGFLIEAHVGHEISNEPFVSPRGVRFVCGELGLGHVFLFSSDAAKASPFYRDVLGFRLSDTVVMGGNEAFFLHCNPRHHTAAFGTFDGIPSGIGHLMIEVGTLEQVGRALDIVQSSPYPVQMSIGEHTNDRMTSFYVVTPSAASISGYDIQALASDGTVVKEVSATGHEAVITGLADATHYRFQVRARTVHGAGPWRQSAQITTQTSPESVQQYIDAVRQYHEVQNSIKEGTAPDVESALEGRSQAALVRAIIHSVGGDLSTWVSNAADHGLTQRSSTVTIDESLVTLFTDTGRIVVHAKTDIEVTYVSQEGTADEKINSERFQSTRDYVFRAGTDASLTGESDGLSTEDAIQGGEGNAQLFSATATIPAGAPSLPVDGKGFPVVGSQDGPSNPPAPSSLIDRNGIKLWALEHAYDEPEYENDCTNFVSQSIYFGGRARMSVPAGPLSGLTERKDPYYWYQNWPHNLLTSYSWTGVNLFYKHFVQLRGRATFVPSWSQVQPGDILLFSIKGTNFGHASVVTRNRPGIGTPAWYGIYYAQHTGAGAYRSLVKGFAWWKDHYPQGKVYAIRINR